MAPQPPFHNADRNGVVPAPEPTDEMLMTAVVARDERALEALYDRYARRIYLMASHLIGSADAEEVVQETFVRLWTRSNQFDASRGKLRTWLLAIARNYMLNRLRQRLPAERVARVGDVDHLIEGAADRAPDVEAVAWDRERSRRALGLLRQLPSEQRRVLILAYFGGLSQSEIAEALACPIGTVKTRTRLALDKLRAGLRRELGEPETEPPSAIPGKGKE